MFYQFWIEASWLVRSIPSMWFSMCGFPLPWARGDTNQSPVLIYSTGSPHRPRISPIYVMWDDVYSVLHAQITYWIRHHNADQWAELKSMVVLYTLRSTLLLNAPKCRCNKTTFDHCNNKGGIMNTYTLLEWRIYAMSLHITIRTKDTEWRKGEREIYMKSEGNSM